MSTKSRSFTVPVSSRLKGYISHYWLSGPKQVHIALPDGSVDLVIQVHKTDIASWLYGTTTERIDIPLPQHCHYLGIRFKPGQSRHFIKPDAFDLTDSYTEATQTLRFSLDAITESLDASDLIHQLNTLFENHLTQYDPSHQRIDDAIQCIESTRGAIRIQEAAEVFGQSRRHFERVFLDTVGISAKTFARIIRFQHAAKYLCRPSLSLSHIAAELNYTDQSHMTRDFKHLVGVSPTQFTQNYVAFLQDSHLG